MTKRILLVVFTYLVDVGAWLQSLPIFPIFFRRVLIRFIGIRVGVGGYFNPHIVFNKNNIVFGDYCAVGKNSYFDGSGEILIGNRVYFGPGVSVLTATHDIMPSVYRRDRANNVLKRTVIGDGCWIGARAVVLPGVVVEKGVVIAAGSVVVKNCLENGLYIGVPAVRVKDLPVITERPFYNGKII